MDHRRCCHYDAKAFPSAGLLPFLQSYLCSLRNPCRKSPTTGDDTNTINGNIARQSLVVKIIRIMAEIYAAIGSEPDKWANLWNTIIRLVDILAQLKSEAFQMPIPISLLISNEGPLSLLFSNKKLHTLCDNKLRKKGLILEEDVSDAMFLCDLSWLQMVSTSEKIVETKELEHIFKTLNDFRNDLLIEDMVSIVADLIFNNSFSITSALYCGSDSFDQLSRSKESIPERGAATSAYSDDRNKVYDFLRHVMPHSEDKHDQKKDFCGTIPIRSDNNCSFLEAAELSQLMPIINGYILLSPASPVITDFTRKLSNPLRWFSLLYSSIVDFNQLAPHLQLALFKSKLHPASKTVIELLKLLEKSGILRSDWAKSLSSTLETMFNTPDDDSSLFMQIKRISLYVEDILQCFTFDRFFIVSNESELVNCAQCLMDYNQYMAGIVILGIDQNSTDLPSIVTYKIRYPPNYIDSTRQIMDSFAHQSSRDHFLVDLKYLTFGFSFLQEAVDRIIIENATAQEFATGLYAQQEPYKCSFIDKFDIMNFLEMFVILSWMIPSALLVKNIVHEKEMRLKEMMRIMGLGDSIHWVSWSLQSFLLCFISTLFISLLLKLFFPQTAVAYGLELIHLADINYMTSWSAITSIYVRVLKKICHYLITTEYGITLSTIIIAFALDTFIYAILAWYVSAVFPGAYGVPQPFYFCLTLRYWLGDKYITHTSLKSYSSDITSENFEQEPVDLNLTVNICNLVKIYNNGIKALNNLNIRFFESEITAFLGHNGAGKTTTISILTGFTKPTSGNVFVYGLNLKTDIQTIRSFIGICPQHNILFDKLTVAEQLRFYGALKGIPKHKLDSEVSKTIKDLGFSGLENKFANLLSGGMKRKLCIGIALIGGSKLVILDEPTAGVDAHSRRFIWDILMRNKTGRTIILSTHHMDEADVLADRIAIISEGQLRAAGSSLFLKKKFGNGLHLHVWKASSVSEESENPLHNFLLKQTGGHCVLAEQYGNEELYQISDNLGASDLKKLFEEIDALKDEFGIINYGITAPTLQQVFLKLAPNEERILQKDQRRLWIAETFCFLDHGHPVVTYINDKTQLRNQQLKAAIMKRLHISRRSIVVMCIEILVPIFLIFAAEIYRKLVVELSISYKPEPEPPLELVSGIYGDWTLGYFSLENQNQTTRGEEYLKAMMVFPGTDVRCTDDSPLNPALDGSIYSCYVNVSFLTNLTLPSAPAPFNVPQKCGCDFTGWNCTADDDFNYTLRNVTLPSANIFYDVTYRNLSQFRLLTSDLAIKYPLMTGGWQFAQISEVAFDAAKTSSAQRGFIETLNFLESASKAWNIDWQHIVDNISFVDNRFKPDNKTFKDLIVLSLANMDKEENTKIWYNNKLWASLPIFTNAYHNAVLRSGNSYNPASMGILTYSHPINYTLSSYTENVPLLKMMSFRIILLLLAVSLISASFGLPLVEERVSLSKHLQMISGLSPLIYWLAVSVYDIIIFLIAAVIIVIGYIILEVDQFAVSFLYSVVFFILLFCTGLTLTSLTYLCQMIFSIPSLAYIVIGVGFFFIGANCTTVVIFLESQLLQDKALVLAYDICSVLFMALPHYNFGMAVYRLNFVTLLRMQGESYLSNINRKDELDHLPLPNPLEWHLMGKHLIALIVQFHIFSIILLLIEYRFQWHSCTKYSELKRTKKLLSASTDSNVDEDVVKERKKIENLVPESSNDYRLIVRNVSKSYDGQTLAVRDVTFAVKNGECLGLLGVNGAGKTTMFRMLTGQMSIGAGDAFINSLSIQYNSSSNPRSSGYCPQFDALNPKLTAREHLRYYSFLRGIRKDCVDKVVNWTLNELHLNTYADEVAGSYSGGNKRKLSVALALVADPPLLLLDEPSSGMDPSTQRFMWNVLLKLRKNKRAMVVTSHSMEECEVLCSRVAIMNRGELQCVGPIQHLKQRFGEGYSLTIRLSKKESIKSVQNLMATFLPASRLAAVHSLTMFYQIPNASSTVAHIFDVICKMQDTIEIADYSLSQTTLDDMFVSFVEMSCNECDPSKTPSSEN
ncbi:unnamed protein product [Thelazia callipaeda]|uniref:ABC transporter domain-containing protein n=1 Tax=Thelazia callipaeda TaxID=103827 RepID=A0A0N5CJV3_THECL|nr:unnamed protein product [Thelazia callipaeda]